MKEYDQKFPLLQSDTKRSIKLTEEKEINTDSSATMEETVGVLSNMLFQNSSFTRKTQNNFGYLSSDKNSPIKLLHIENFDDDSNQYHKKDARNEGKFMLQKTAKSNMHPVT